jgi:hypothetical protein
MGKVILSLDKHQRQEQVHSDPIELNLSFVDDI